MMKTLWPLIRGKTAGYLATLGSAGILAGAFGFQYIAGLSPCALCLWQRWPHAAAILIGLAFYLLGWRILAWLGALAALATSGLGMYHVGVEQGWWLGPSTCSASGARALRGQDLVDSIMNAPLVLCDDIAWQMLGVSMAGWNAIASLGFAVLWIIAALTMQKSANS